MKKAAQSIVAALLIAAASSNALADPRPVPRPPASHYYRDGGHADWLGALLFIGMAAAFLNAAASSPSPPPTHYVAPPPPPAPQVAPRQEAPVGVWYFCRSANQYYPYVRDCPEEWEQVPSVPQ